jgi:hypothetical protein
MSVIFENLSDIKETPVKLTGDCCKNKKGDWKFTANSTTNDFKSFAG